MVPVGVGEREGAAERTVDGRRNDGPTVSHERVVDVLHARGVEPDRDAHAGLRHGCQIGSRDDVAERKSDRRGFEHDRVRRPGGRTHQAHVPLVERLRHSEVADSCLELLAQRPGLSNSELARGAFVTRQSMNVLLQNLEQLGQVTRPAEAPVGKVLPTELTPTGRAILKKATAAVRSVELRMLSGMTADEQTQALRILRSMIHSLRDGAP